MLLYQVRFEHERLDFVIHHDKFEIRDYLYELPRLWIVVSARMKVRPHTVSQVLCLANIHDLARRIFVNVDSGIGWQGFELFRNGHLSILA